LERAGLFSRLHRPPAICFLEITGYTRLTEERGDEAAADLATSSPPLVRRASQEHGGRPVKWLGDGVMFYFREPGGALLAALEMVEGPATHDLPPAHVGLHEGQVISRTVTTSPVRSISRRGSPTTSDRARWW
jgi:adenylate cyclase